MFQEMKLRQTCESQLKKYTFVVVFTNYLLSFEIMGDKVLLQFLVGVVDTKLLQVVELEALKPVDIQQT